jgi:hypothetical protein
MEGSCEYVGQTVVDSRREVVLEIWGSEGSKTFSTKNGMLHRTSGCYEHENESLVSVKDGGLGCLMLFACLGLHSMELKHERSI